MERRDREPMRGGLRLIPGMLARQGAARYDDAVALRDAAARPVVEQIRADMERLDGPARLILERFAADLFSPELKVSALLKECKAKGTRSLERFQAVTAVPQLSLSSSMVAGGIF